MLRRTCIGSASPWASSPDFFRILTIRVALRQRCPMDFAENNFSGICIATPGRQITKGSEHFQPAHSSSSSFDLRYKDVAP